MAETLVVNEIYLSLQGESTFAGLPCIFVRLTACNLRCSYCDTAYAFTEGRKMSPADVVSQVNHLASRFAPRDPNPPADHRLTGGEPLQPNSCP
jgi:7-carboxy-7-deazaguanine synthase